MRQTPIVCSLPTPIGATSEQIQQPTNNTTVVTDSVSGYKLSNLEHIYTSTIYKVNVDKPEIMKLVITNYNIRTGLDKRHTLSTVVKSR